MTRVKKFNLAFPWEGTLLLIGIILRLRQYLSGRSLWADEAMLALNIVNRNFSQLFQPLDYDQGAPLGFLLVEKLFHAALGRTEFALRLFPLLAGLASLWLFHLLLVSLRGAHSLRSVSTPRRSNLLALALFAVNPQLVYYTSEAKQYIMDVTVALGMFVIALPMLQGQFQRKNLILLMLAGMLALWFSHPALFVLAGIGVGLLIHLLQQRDRASLRWIIFIGVLWLGNLTLLYFINLRQLSRNDYLTDYWTNGFLPLPPWRDFGWLNELMIYQFGIHFVPLLVSILILVGWVAWLRESRTLAIAIAFTTLFAFMASALRLYPVNARLSLFLIPLGILLLGKAIEVAQHAMSFNKVASIAVAALLGGYLFLQPFVTSFNNFISPKYYEHIRPTMQVLADSWKDGDALFVTAWAEPAFRYYAPFYGLEGVEITSNEIGDYPNGEQLKSRFDPLIGEKRVWVLFSHVYEQEGFNERDFLVAYLDEIGEKRREILKSGTSVYLFFYDLSR
jgi:hypothetical protein